MRGREKYGEGKGTCLPPPTASAIDCHANREELVESGHATHRCDQRCSQPAMLNECCLTLPYRIHTRARARRCVLAYVKPCTL